MTYLDFSNSLVRLKSDIRHRGVNHEREQVQDEVSVAP